MVRPNEPIFVAVEDVYAGEVIEVCVCKTGRVCHVPRAMSPYCNKPKPRPGSATRADIHESLENAKESFRLLGRYYEALTVGADVVRDFGDALMQYKKARRRAKRREQRQHN